MTDADIELLDLATKAAGIKVLQRDARGYWNIEVHERGMRGWNPLIDDGDALRLAVKLCLEVTPAGDYTAVRRFNTNEWVTEEWGYDPYDPRAATRRAIVRAAAEIGRAMP